MIAVVGHANLTPDTLELVETALRERVQSLSKGATGLVRTGAGLPVVFGRVLRDVGRRLVLLLPAQDSVPAIVPPGDQVATGELLTLAEQVQLLPYDPLNRNACVSADEHLISTCGRLLAVWDGSPSDGRDATAHLVAYARTRGIPVEVVWPPGAAREEAA
ncbi:MULTISPECIES: hypothetical protein [unclassified Streptomyces]|uniref:hypothetical protein n=1 Tax=unclassified Streptomyces TaxID=2593676 RepID=UPI00344DAA71